MRERAEQPAPAVFLQAPLKRPLADLSCLSCAWGQGAAGRAALLCPSHSRHRTPVEKGAAPHRGEARTTPRVVPVLGAGEGLGVGEVSGGGGGRGEVWRGVCV